MVELRRLVDAKTVRREATPRLATALPAVAPPAPSLPPGHRCLSDGRVTNAEYDRQRARHNAIRRAQVLWEQSRVPPRYFDADLDALGDVTPAHRAAAERLRRLLDEPATLALIGGRGPGKTWLGCALVRAFCRAGRSARYCTAVEIFAMIRNAWDHRGERGVEAERDVLARLERVDLLVIDELQERSDSAWASTVLTSIVDTRYAYLRSTIVIANLGRGTLVANLGDSIASRMSEGGGVIECSWPSLRANGKARHATPARDARGNEIYPPVSPLVGDPHGDEL